MKKGTDSRVGFGFRLGDHADFQVLLELGPQTNTKPIGTNGGDSDNTFKRHVNSDDYNNIQKDNIESDNETKLSQNDASKWLKNWYKDTNKKKAETIKIQNTQTNKPKEMNSVKTVSMISQESLNQLQQLYKWAENNSTTTESISTSTKTPEVSNMSLLEIITPRNKDHSKVSKELMDVELE